MLTETISAQNAAGHTEVLSALRAASAKTGSDFDYLLATAQRESSLDSHAKSKSSSATGLFQFIDQTWLGLVKRFGERHGLGVYAGAIRETGKGRFDVSSPDAKAAILALRQNPALSALMAGEAANETRQNLECALGRGVCSGELYAAHFLGPNGARQLIQLNDANPNARADTAFPQAAQANRSVFYHADGTPKTVGEVYAWAVALPGQDGGQTAPASVTKADPQVRTAATATPMTTAQYAAMLNDASPETVRAARLPETGDETQKQSQPGPRYAISESWKAANAEPQISSARLPQSPLLLTPGVMEILAAFTPMGARRAS